ATVQDGRVVVQNVQGRQNIGQGNNVWGAGAVGYGGAWNRVGNANPGQTRQVKCYNCNGVGHISRNCTQPKRPQNSEYFKDKMLLMQAQENRVVRMFRVDRTEDRVKCYNCNEMLLMQAQENGLVLDEEQLLFLAGGQDNAIYEDVDEQPVQDLALNVDEQPVQNSEYFKDKMLLMQALENGVVLDEEQLLFLAGGQDNAIDEDVDEQPVQDLALNVDNVFQADDCDAYDSDVDEAPTAQTMFMANLSSVDPVYDEAGPSYNSDILSEVHDHDHYQDAVCDHHEEHEMHDDVQPNHVVQHITPHVPVVHITP
ncbi:retrovirus-related pol polyprotein from transposon TNT 1-94, partial [Tanacetum coccineum]